MFLVVNERKGKKLMSKTQTSVEVRLQIEEELHKQLTDLARCQRRSLQQQLIFMLENSHLLPQNNDKQPLAVV